jgi:hypothetical protein
MGWQEQGNPQQHPTTTQPREKALVYLAPEKAFHKLSTTLDLQGFLRRCDSNSVQEAQRQIKAKLPDLEQLPLHPPHA